MFDIRLECSLDFLADEYVGLFGRSRATAFQHPLWLHHIYRDLAPRLNAEPIVIAARRPDGQLAMILPLLRRRHGPLQVIEFADLEVTDYASAVCDEAACAQLLADPLAGEKICALLKPYDLIRIKKIPDGSPPVEQLFGVKDREQMDVSAHAVGLHGPFSDWRRKSIDASYLKELDVKRRKMNRKGAVLFERVENPELIRSTLAAIRDYRCERFGELELLRSEAHYEFYRDLALQGHVSGYSRTYRMSLDGRPIGGVWGLVHRRRFLTLLSGCDIAGYKRLSIGSLLFEDLAQDCIASGDLLLDFTVGDESYKQLFGARPSSLWMFSAAASAPGMLANLVAQIAPWALSFARDVLHQKPRPSTPKATES